jgi:DNA-binding NarL/FixJ family response regulator
VSDVRLHREGVAMILSRIETIDIVGTSAASDGLARMGELRPDIILLDSSLVDSLALPKRMREVIPGVKIVAFAVSGDERDVIACAEAGISAYVARDGSAEDLVAAIHQAMRGEFTCSPRITALLFSYLAALSAERAPLAAAGALTHREREIVPLIEQGLSNKEIARGLRLEATTVKNHIHNILEKLKVRRRGEIAARVRQGRSSLPLLDPRRLLKSQVHN